MSNNLYTEPFKTDNYLLMKFSSTMRYSTTFSLIKESIADHSAQISLLILLHKSKYPVLFTFLNLTNLLIHATLHDLPEVISGDVVSPIKRLTPEIHESFKKIEDTCITSLSESRQPEFNSMLVSSGLYELSNLDKIYFKLVDSLVVYFKAKNELSLNNSHYSRVLTEISEVITELFHEFKFFYECLNCSTTVKLILKEELTSLIEEFSVLETNDN